MKNFKYLCFKRFNQFFLLSLSMSLSMVLLMLRIKIHQEFFFLFLVWNLFLALIPYFISTLLISKSRHNKLLLTISFGAWLAFLPNAPYIVTDLIHLKVSNSRWIWLDVLLVSSFAINGMALFLLSLGDMKTILDFYVKDYLMTYFIPAIAALTGFGIYLGRFLRYNSWEIIQNPFTLANDILSILVYPKQHIDAWLFTIAFGMFLYVMCLMFNGKVQLEFDEDRDFL